MNQSAAHRAAVNAPLALRLATLWRTRATGLLLRPRLLAGHGLWLLRCRAVHTIGMRYPIGVFFLDDQDRVTRAIGCARPCSWAYDVSAVSVIETLSIGAGELSRAVSCVEQSARLARAQLDQAPATPRRSARGRYQA